MDTNKYEHCNNTTYINEIKSAFTSIEKKYNKLFTNNNDNDNDNLLLLELLNNGSIPQGSLIDIEVSMRTLDIELQSALFIVESINIEELSRKQLLQNDLQRKTDKIIDKTMSAMLPLFMLYLMMIDKDSILNSCTFGKFNNDNNNYNNDINNGNNNGNNNSNSNNNTSIQTTLNISKTSNIPYTIPYIELD